MESILSFQPAGGKPFTTTLNDAVMGSVRLTGILDEPSSDSLVLTIHGHGSNANSRSCADMARAARHAGIASLRLSQRGADLSGEDIYHGGLTDDLKAALSSPEILKYKKIFVAGYSIGGQIAMRSVIDRVDPRIRAVAAICSPLDVAAAADEFDRPTMAVYRSHVFSGLNRVYATTAKRRTLPTPIETVRKARSVRERDELTVVKRFGFQSADQYYKAIQMSDQTQNLDLPSLLVTSQNDPIVPMHTLRRAICNASPALSVVSVNAGGHMYFPKELDLGQKGDRGLENQVIQWLISNQ